MKTYRRVNRQMGAWKWGHPRGHRIGIVEYRSEKNASGLPVWKSCGFVCEGITAGNEKYMRQWYPIAFEFEVGSIHNHLVVEED